MPEQPGGRTRPGRLLRSLIRPSRAQLLTGLILFVCAVAVITQLNAKSADNTFSSMRRSDLVTMLDTLNTESSRLQSEIQQMQATKAELISGADAAKIAAQDAQKRLDTLGILAGTVPAHGPGVHITIRDPQGKLTPEILLDAIEELRDAGAEAIQINDSIRVVASTWFGSAAGGVTMEGVKLSTPIVLDVIGEPQALTEGADFRGGLVSVVESSAVGGTVAISTLQDVRVDAVHVTGVFTYAKPA